MKGEHLQLVDHDDRKIYDLGKILGGGVFDARVSDFCVDDDIDEPDVREYRSHLLLDMVGKDCEFVISNSPRCDDILERGYEIVSLTDPIRARKADKYG